MQPSETSFEFRIAQALTDHGGPPELAPQLVALAGESEINELQLTAWIRFHIAAEWSAQQFRHWAERYNKAAKSLDAVGGTRPAPLFPKKDEQK